MALQSFLFIRVELMEKLEVNVIFVSVFDS